MAFGKKQTHSRDSQGADINLTSFVDIIFNLLLFFMLTATVADNPALDIKLPQASNADAQVNPKDLKLSLTKAGVIRLGKEEITKDRLQLLLKAYGEQKDSRVILRADQASPHGQVMEIIDMIKGAGIDQLAIAATPGA